MVKMVLSSPRILFSKGFSNFDVSVDIPSESLIIDYVLNFNSVTLI